jgi:hypothetical protein
MEVRDEDRLNRVQSDGVGFQPDERRSAAVDEEIHRLAGDVKTGVEAPAATECVSAADEP